MSFINEQLWAKKFTFRHRVPVPRALQFNQIRSHSKWITLQRLTSSPQCGNMVYGTIKRQVITVINCDTDSMAKLGETTTTAIKRLRLKSQATMIHQSIHSRIRTRDGMHSTSCTFIFMFLFFSGFIVRPFS